MPPRWISLAIIAFWLCTTGWLVYQDVWPLLLPGDAPPYTIDLEDEVQTQLARIRWTVFYNDRPCYHAETWVEPNPADDTFALASHLGALPPAETEGAGRRAGPLSGLIDLKEATSVYTVTRQGDLREVSIDLTAVVHVGLSDVTGKGSLTGEVRDGRFLPHVRASASGPLASLADWSFDEDLDPVPVPAHGSVLSPMHPVNRVTGLRPGRTWRLPLVDPVLTVFSALIKKHLGDLGPAPEESVVTARVLPQMQSLRWNNQAVECVVVEYTGDDVSARTWVRAGDGLVLRQEAERGGDRWALQRE